MIFWSFGGGYRVKGLGVGVYGGVLGELRLSRERRGIWAVPFERFPTKDCVVIQDAGFRDRAGTDGCSAYKSMLRNDLGPPTAFNMLKGSYDQDFRQGVSTPALQDLEAPN